MMSEKLHKIARIKLGDKEYDLAKNGNFRIVDTSGLDAYGAPVAEEVPPKNWATQAGVQELTDALGEAWEKINSYTAARERRMGAAEPEA
jgi:hypothetical protein